jgi:outer membrane autotransporter protein
MAYASSTPGHTGFAAGDGAMSKSAWLRPFISGADQDQRTDSEGGEIDGYNSSSTGVSGGFDGMVGDQTRLGLSFSYADTEIDGDGVQNDKTNIENYQFTIYGDYTADNIYFEGMFSYGTSSIDTSREITFGGLNLLAKGDYDANQYAWRVGAGIPVIRGRSVFTPNANFQYTSVESDTYTETGAGVLNLVVAPEDLDMAVASFGVNWQSAYQSKGGTWTPQIRTSVSYDFAGDDADSVSRFTGQTTTFTTKGAEVEELGAAVGAGLTMSSANGAWDVTADYDAEMKTDYLAHTGSLKAKLNF